MSTPSCVWAVPVSWQVLAENVVERGVFSGLGWGLSFLDHKFETDCFLWSPSSISSLNGTLSAF